MRRDEVEAPTAETLAVVAGQNIEPFDFEPFPQSRLGLGGTDVHLEVGDGPPVVPDPGGVTVRVEQIGWDDLDRERAREVRGQVRGRCRPSAGSDDGVVVGSRMPFASTAVS